MRNPYNHVFQFFRGPLSPTPDVLIAEVAGRFVPDKEIRYQGLPFMGNLGYVTTDFPFGAACSLLYEAPDYTLRVGTEDQIACPAIGLAPTPIQWVETVTPGVGDPYVRYHIGPWVENP